MRRLLSIAAAVPAAVFAALAVIFALNAMLPHGKSWQMPLVLGSGFVAGLLAAVATMRAIVPFTRDEPIPPRRHPLD